MKQNGRRMVKEGKSNPLFKVGFRPGDLVREVGFCAGLMLKIRGVFAHLVRNVSWMEIRFEFYKLRPEGYATEVRAGHAAAPSTRYFGR